MRIGCSRVCNQEYQHGEQTNLSFSGWAMKISTKDVEEYILAALYPTHDNVWRAFINMAFDPHTVEEQTVEEFIDRMKLPNAKYAFMSTMLGIRNTTNLSSRLNKILSPTIIVWGEQDEMIPVKYAEDYRNIPNSNLKVIPKGVIRLLLKNQRYFLK